MPCINPDGTLTVTAKRALVVLEEPGSESDVANRVGIPLYRVRSLLRDLIEAGFVCEKDGEYHLVRVNDKDEEEEDLPEPF